jgi:hypothetical protein
MEANQVKMMQDQVVLTGRVAGLRIFTLPEFGIRVAFTIEIVGQQPIFCAVEGNPARVFITLCCDGDIVTVTGFHETRPSTAAANTPWTGRFRVRAVYTAQDFWLAA